MSSLQMEVDAPPYRVIVSVRTVAPPGLPGKTTNYVAQAMITRLDGSSVYETCPIYHIYDGDTFIDSQSAMRDGEQRARDAIKTGFPR
ncbi:hypothetical protein G3N95_02150 [Paraburkholderia sp. Tr-20389]|uniref:hypothetical protein n=1 Tax=Paraburkholderia sp. Tr-20389 TaxID=2703903 RepID=UPI001981C4F4|nr:hypothetical protein [Paraburkholderia sp. Tr-20389]MBN3751724.1 hypothetical protein [Paraburkholderia sp. Tr-20389]